MLDVSVIILTLKHNHITAFDYVPVFEQLHAYVDEHVPLLLCLYQGIRKKH